jgi:hypothetical protein
LALDAPTDEEQNLVVVGAPSREWLQALIAPARYAPDGIHPE